MNVHNGGSQREAAEANVRGCIDSIAQNRGTTIETVSGVAIAQALLAIHDTLETIAGALANPQTQAVPICPSRYDKNMPYVCMLPLAHPGKHECKERTTW